MWWRARNKWNEFSVIGEEKLTGDSGESFGVGDSFTYHGAETTMRVRDNDRGLAGDSWRNERGNDRQRGQIQEGDEWVSIGNTYAEQFFVLHDDQGRCYYLIEIEATRLSNDEAVDDYFTFFGAVPPVGANLTAASANNVWWSFSYAHLGAGETLLPPIAADDALTISEDDAGAVNVLTNDQGGIADALIVGAVNGDATLVGFWVDLEGGGRVLIAADGQVSFDPDGDFETLAVGEIASVSVDYTVQNAFGDGDTATLSVTVTGVNDAPVAQDDAAAGDEDNAITGQVAASDVDGDTLTFALNTGPANGQVTVNADGSYTYTPDANFNGADSFTVLVSDGNGGTDVATVSLTVNPINDAPIPEAEVASVDEDGVLNGLLRAEDVDGDTLTFALASGPANGQITINPAGDYTYTPNADFNGVDTFTYTIDDGNGAVLTETATITVNAVNDAPVPTPEAPSMDEDNTLIGELRGTDVDGDALTFTVTSGVSNGTLVVQPTGQYTYTPNADFNGEDSFTYTIDDGNGGVVTNTAIITVNAINDAPIAADDAAEGDEDNVITGQVAASDVDGDTLTFALNTGPANGQVTVNADGSYTYTPDADFNGEDSFTYTIDDGNGGIVTNTAIITVNAVNDAPIPEAEVASVDEDGVLDGLLRAEDVDGDTLTFALNTGPANGQITINPAGDYTYTPNADFNGEDTFTYTIDDGNGAVLTETATITVNAVNDAPVPTPEAPVMDEDTTLIGELRGTDVDGDALTFTVTSGVSNGALVVQPTGQYTYTPNADFNGEDSFTYTINDGNGGVITNTAIITVNAVNDAPVPEAEVASVDEDGVLNGLLRAEDVDGDALTFALATGPANGQITINPAGDYTYTPNADFNGEDSFTYTIDDGNGGIVTNTAIITVNAINDAPVPTPEAPAMDEDTTLIGELRGTDVDGDALTFTVTSGVGNGTLVVQPTGQYTYTPNADFNGEDSFTYTIDDGNGGVITNTAIITVNAINDAPVPTPEAPAMEEDTTLIGELRGTDVDGDALTFTVTSGVSNGTLVVQPTGQYTYTPDADFNGEDSFTYTIDDGNGGIVTNTAIITVNAVNDAPALEVGPQAAVFDGSTHFSGDPEALAVREAFTIEMWINPDNLDNFQMLVSTDQLGVDTNSSVNFSLNSAGNIGFEVNNLGSFSSTGGLVQPGEWTHVALTHSEASSGPNTFLFVNGVEVASAVVPQNFAFQDFLVGRRGLGNNFEGQMTELRLWEVERSEAEIAADMNTRQSFDEPGLLGYWSFNEVSGDAVDRTLSGNNLEEIGDIPRIVSDAPLDGGVIVAEDGSADFAIGFSDVDVDEGDGQVQAVLTVDHGALNVGDLASVTIAGDETASVTITGAADDVQQALTDITFHAETGFAGDATVTAQISDLGNTGAGGVLTDTDTIIFDVVPRNDAPTITTSPMAGRFENGSFFNIGVNQAGGLRVDDDFTVELWVNPDSVGAFQTLVSSDQIGVDNTNSLNVYLTAGGGVEFEINNNDFFATQGGLLAAGDWNHVAVTHESGGDTVIYVNGAEQARSSDMPDALSFIDFMLGRRGLGNEFTGEMADVRLWDVARTQSEIADNMSVTLSDDQVGLRAYYTFNEVGGDVIDRTSGDNDLSENGTVLRVLSEAPVDGSAAIALDAEASARFGVRVDDPDVGDGDIDVSISVNDGAVSVDAVAGLAVTGNGGDQLTLIGGLAEVNDALDSMIFSPDGIVDGGESVTIRVNDLGGSGFGGEQSDEVVLTFVDELLI